MASARTFSGLGTTLASTTLVAASYVAVLVAQGADRIDPLRAGIMAAGYLAALIIGPRIIERRPWGSIVVFPILLLLTAGLLAQARLVMSLAPLAVVSQAVLYLRLRWAIAVVAAIAAMTILPALIVDGIDAAAGVLSFLTAIAFVGVFSASLGRQHDARLRATELAAELAAAHAEQRRAMEQIEELASARERNRIAREVHDGLGHALTVAHVQLEAIRGIIRDDPDRADAMLLRVQSVVQGGLRDVRRSVGILRDSSRPQALRDALEESAAELRADGLAVSLVLPERWAAISPAAAHVLYRAAQEAMTNVRKHSHARAVAISVDSSPTVVRLRIADDGEGAIVIHRGFGLVGLRERVAALGGDVEISTAPGRGFELTVELPRDSVRIDPAEQDC